MSAVHGVHTDVDNTTPGAEKLESADLKEFLALNGEKTEQTVNRTSQNFGNELRLRPGPDAQVDRDRLLPTPWVKGCSNVLGALPISRRAFYEPKFSGIEKSLAFISKKGGGADWPTRALQFDSSKNRPIDAIAPLLTSPKPLELLPSLPYRP